MAITAQINRFKRLQVDIQKNKKISARLDNVTITSEGYRPPKYEGEYVVTPSTSNQQTLKTAQTLLENDVTVLKIPYFDVSNNSGGTTVYIGNEV